MSKIEKALRRARGDGKSLLVSTASNVSGQLVPFPLSGQEQALSEVEVRARSSEAIALMRESQLLDKNALSRHGIIYPEMSDDPTVQAFREIRTKILQQSTGRNCIIMVTGATLGSGATFVSLNLAAAFAFDAGKTALLMDCNLRNPSLQQLCPDKSTPGLTDYLENSDMDIGQIIHSIGVERLRIIPAGGNREIPAEYFTSTKMKRLLENVYRRYPERFIILDAPPTTESADMQILAELCDYVVLVVPYGKVTPGQIEECLKGIEAKKLIGVVFNNEPRVPSVPWRDILDPVGLLRRVLAKLMRIKEFWPPRKDG